MGGGGDFISVVYRHQLCAAIWAKFGVGLLFFFSSFFLDGVRGVISLTVR